MTLGRRRLAAVALVLGAGIGLALGEPGSIELSVNGGTGLGNSALRVALLLTLLTVAPSILLLMTCFVRFIIALHFLRQALGTPQMPPNQVVIGLALFLTLFAMGPTIDRVHDQAWVPYEQGEIDEIEGIRAAAQPMREFMLSQTRDADLKLFVRMARLERPEGPEALPLRVVIPAYVVSELRAGFQIGFLLFLPFLVIDLVVASILLSMGMMMLPPAMVSLPFKILLFVLVDGWSLIAGSLVAGLQ
ncbi:MAG: hypothetical protein Kow0062_25450 [Acidobacteriota bacterium]|nr:MAG: flagellar biosynthetic protein FliP [Acidobacteriota bacterium]